MAKVKIELEIDIDIDVTEDQIIEFVRFELGEVASIPASNPLAGYDLGSFAPDYVDISID